MELTESFMEILVCFQPVFTTPSYQTFRLLMSGWIYSMRHRYVTDLIVSSDSVGNGHFSGYHRFFSHARWDINRLWELLARMLVSTFFGPDAVIGLAGDDTLCRKRGLNLFGAGMHHDPLISSRKMKLVSWGHDWVLLYLLLVNPWWAPTKVFALPICMRLYRNKQGVTKGQKTSKRRSRAGSNATGHSTSQGSTKRQRKLARRARRTEQRQACGEAGNAEKTTHQTRPELMREMLQLVASWFPERRFLFAGDSLYTGESVLRHLPRNVDLIGAVHPQGALYEPAPEQQSGRGRRRKKGDRLSAREDWATDGSRWKRLNFHQYGLHGAFETKTRTGLYYKAGKERLLKFVLTRDTKGDRPTQIFYCTNLNLGAREILSHYAHRWAVEVTHHDAKQLLGFEDPANRTPPAVQRTAPMAMFLYSLTVLWYAQHGHQHLKFPNRPWYRRKCEPSFGDMLTTLRRISWEQHLSTVPPHGTLWKKAFDQLKYLATLAG